MPLTKKTTDRDVAAEAASVSANAAVVDLDQEDQDAFVVDLVKDFLEPISTLLIAASLALEESIYAGIKEFTLKVGLSVSSISECFLLIQNQRKVSATFSHIVAKLRETPQAQSDEIIMTINIFEGMLRDRILYRVAEFLDRLMADRAILAELLFSNMELTERNINKAYKKLTLLCHPDKCTNHPREKTFEEFFKILKEETEWALERLDKERSSVKDHTEEVNYHQEKGSYYRRLVIDWQNAEKGRYSEFKVLTRQDVENKTLTEKEQFKIDFAFRASEQYRAACRVVDRQLLNSSTASLSPAKLRQLQELQIWLRKEIALMLYVAGVALDAQLYAIGAAQLLLRTDWCQLGDFEEINQILDKINKKHKKEPEKKQTASPMQASKETAITPVGVRTIELFKGSSLAPFNSPAGRKQRTAQVKQELSTLMIEYLAKPESRIVSYTTPHELIVQAENQVVLHRLRGLVYGGGGAGIALIAVAAAAIDIGSFAATGATLGIFGGPIGAGIGLALGLIVGGIGVYFGWNIFQKGRELSAEPAIRRELNEIITTAIEFYQKGDYLSCVRALSVPYGRSGEKRLLEFSDDKDSSFINVDAALLRDTLLSHGFHSDGIAYILVLLGEILASGKLVFKKTTLSSQQDQSSRLFLCAADELPGNEKVLMRKAEALDEVIRQWNPVDSGAWFKRLRRYFLVEYYGVSQAYLERCIRESNEAPYVGRLREMQLTAKLNVALLQIIIGNKDNLELASICLSEMYEAIHYNYQYFAPIESRLSAVEDFLVALGYDPELRLKKDVIKSNSLQLAHMPTAMSTVPGEVMPVSSFVTKLDQPIDILDVIRTLSKGLVNFSWDDFAEKLQAYKSSIGDATCVQNVSFLLEEMSRKNSLGLWALRCYYLPIISAVTQVKFELYESISERSCSRLAVTLQPVCLQPALATVCFVVDDGYLTGESLPVLLFVEEKDPTLLEIGRRLHILFQGRNNEEIIANTYLQQANCHYESACEVDKKSHARSLIEYEEALKSYERSLTFMPTSEACWGIVECQLAIGQTRRASLFLEQRAKDSKLKLEDFGLFWYYQAKILRHLQEYGRAGVMIHAAIEKDPQNLRFIREQRMIQRLSRQAIEEKQQAYNATQLTYDDQGYQTRQMAKLIDLPNYNILSIDGGGIRGIIPAVILCEVERQLGRPLAHAFDLLAGTSTGGLISLLLSTPTTTQPARPAYKAVDILNLYTTRGPEIFTSDRTFFERLVSKLVDLSKPKYSETGRKELSTHYFGKRRLDTCLTEVVIPAAKQDRPNVTHFFTRHDARQEPDNPAKNVTLVDAGMATSAAPTYFPGHEIVVEYEEPSISGQKPVAKETFVDGGIQVNNPAGKAHSFAIRQGVSPEKVTLWSLGTGDCIRSSLNQGAYQGQFWWAKNLHHFLGAQQNDVDEELHTQMGSRYHRFQFWMDHERIIPLDDIRPKTIDYLVQAGHEVVEENIDELNQLVEQAKLRFGS